MNRPPLGYSTREVARLLGASPRSVRTFVYSGFVHPRRDERGAYRYSFQDLVVLRVACELARSQVPRRRVLLALERLRAELPPGRSLSAVRITAAGGEVVVRSDGELWEPASGQRVIDFEVAELAERAAPLAHRTAAEAERRAEAAGEPWRADEWFELGGELEPTDAREAVRCYRRAIELDPDHAAAHLDLGRLLHEGGDPAAAEEHYRAAVALRPDDGTARFNLGVALQDLGRTGEALSAYRRAVAADPGCADAYFNLAQLYDELGQRAQAIRSLKAYKSLTGG